MVIGAETSLVRGSQVVNLNSPANDSAEADTSSVVCVARDGRRGIEIHMHGHEWYGRAWNKTRRLWSRNGLTGTAESYGDWRWTTFKYRGERDMNTYHSFSDARGV